MMTKLAHIRENRKNNKGFSLVELIIVIAIMVALIAVMGPQYVKYVQSSRDAVIGDAAESTLSVIKSEFALNNLALGTRTNEKITASTDPGYVTIGAAGGNGQVVVASSNVCVGANQKTEANYDLIGALGIDTAKTVKSSITYKITIKSDSTTGGYTFTMEKIEDASSTIAAMSLPGKQPTA